MIRFSLKHETERFNSAIAVCIVFWRIMDTDDSQLAEVFFFFQVEAVHDRVVSSHFQHNFRAIVPRKYSEKRIKLIHNGCFICIIMEKI
jgi:hypothetical protein